MSFESLVNRPAVIQTAGLTADRYNNQVLDWSAPTERSTLMWFAQQSAIEDLDHRDAKVTTGLATFRREAALQPDERVVLDGVTYEVVGDPNYASSPRGPSHIEAVLRVVSG